jgi:hypothetical protein
MENTLHPRHCERSEAIQGLSAGGILDSFAALAMMVSGVPTLTVLGEKPLTTLSRKNGARECTCPRPQLSQLQAYRFVQSMILFGSASNSMLQNAPPWK